MFAASHRRTSRSVNATTASCRPRSSTTTATKRQRSSSRTRTPAAAAATAAATTTTPTKATTFLLMLLLSLSVVDGGNHDASKPNLVYIFTDQQRFDAIRRVQDEMDRYDGKKKINTPNLDRMATYGAYFRKAFTQSPVCSSARGVLRTGLTIERSGLQANNMEKKETYSTMNVFKRKIENTRSLDQILAAAGYEVEYYGKWHLPEFYHFAGPTSQRTAVKKNDYDHRTKTHTLTTDEAWVGKLRRYLAYDAAEGNIQKNFANGDQEDTYTRYPYTPIRLDARYGLPTQTSFDDGYAVLDGRQGQSNILGGFSLGKRYTPIGYNGDVATKAIHRLAKADKAFAVTVSFHNPHAPMTPAKEFLNKYWDDRRNIFVPPSIKDDMVNSAYDNSKFKSYGYDSEFKVKEWTATYYAMIEEIDEWVGKIFDALEKHNVLHNTMVVFTSDHGEMLGAHAMREKNNFYEESVRIPLFIYFPHRIKPMTRVDEPVSHLDLFSTILDYLNVPEDKSDGTSLRRFIENTSYNEKYDETYVVSEWDFRVPIENNWMERALGAETNFMVFKEPYKLMITKLAKASRVDMMYKLDDDPYEMNNLLGRNAHRDDNVVVGKAEHLKCLLLEWMERHNGPGYYGGSSLYSDSNTPPFTDGVQSSRGDMEEIRDRRTWPESDLWVSDRGPSSPLIFGGPFVKVSAQYVRNEYVYFGRTSPGVSRIEHVRIKGDDAGRFEIEQDYPRNVMPGDCVRLRVMYRWHRPPDENEEIDAVIDLSYRSGSSPFSKVVRTRLVAGSSESSTFAPTTRSTRPPTRSPTPGGIFGGGGGDDGDDGDDGSMFGQLFNLFVQTMADALGGLERIFRDLLS